MVELAIASIGAGGITGGCAWQAIRVHIKYLAQNQAKTDKKVEALALQVQANELKQHSTKSRLANLVENMQNREGANHG